jgi:mannose-6-phosphate isomerase
MTLEVARTRLIEKPWGVVGRLPWGPAAPVDQQIGEIWYERPLPSGNPRTRANPTLLLKALLTSKPLSIQVHPDDAYARSMGLPNGKSEAWYVVSAEPGAEVALGLRRAATTHQLRDAILDGSIASKVNWQPVVAGDAIAVPAGTIHAIGAGLVIVEIQQRSDVTFRLFDYGRSRELHVDQAIAATNADVAVKQLAPTRIDEERTLLVVNTHFVFERIDLPPGAARQFDAEHETWLLVVDGNAVVGSTNAVAGVAFFAQADRVDILAGNEGTALLVAYSGTGGPIPHLMESIDVTTAAQSRPVLPAPMPKSNLETMSASITRPLETIQ